jgi:molybdopterin synthase catalytic subunit
VSAVAETRLAHSAFDPADELRTFLSVAERAGAVATFTGLTRPETKTGAIVERMFLDYHPRLTERSLQDIADAAIGRFDVARVRVVHRCGELLPGEPIVFVAAAAAHRRAAFEAADYLMDCLKNDAVFWKREDAVDGRHWIEPTETDRADRARWSD